ncbi:MAG: hypothetical protein GX102_06590 [Porphyromonadaceae bacterium]|jgi:hypothetical protein|nr:hypothetical protein [Porphyromonadaceae bacterium]
MKFKIGFSFIFLIFISCSTTSKALYETDDKSWLSADTINGVYIPKDLSDCIEQIDIILPDTIKEMAIFWSESTFSANTHAGLGMWIRNNWGLWRESRLSHYFNNLGVFHPDDMSDIILTSYHRSLTLNDIKLDEQLSAKKAYWKQAAENKTKQKEEELAKYNIGDTVLFNYPYGYISSLQEDNYFNNTCDARGIVIAKNKNKFTIKVLLLETCDEQGVIVIYDNENTLEYNPQSNQMEKPKERKIIIAKKNQAKWYDYNFWVKNDD